jgi:oxygen-independent coproporphyrinogen III oxidase
LNRSEFAMNPPQAWPTPRAAYIHVPFCARRCGYCNFTLIAGRDDLIGAYLDAIKRELATLGDPQPVDTLFFGGGTPTHLPAGHLARLLRLVANWLPLTGGGEFSVEANPADLDEDRVRLLAEAGVNRISLGVQSFDDRKLAALERDHGAADIGRSYDLARRHIPSVSLDLIFAAPEESLADWRADLDAALRLRPDHVSTYGLTFERGTTFWGRLQRGMLAALPDDTQRDMYAAAIDTLSAAGFEHYEVSNFARPDHRCRHNEVYWAGESYYAFGPGAARYIAGRRETNHRSTTTYIHRVLSGESPVAEAEELSPEDRAREALVLGLRRMAGVDRADFARRTGFDLDALAGADLGPHITAGRLLDDGHSIRLSREGLFVSDAIWPDILRA